MARRGKALGKVGAEPGNHLAIGPYILGACFDNLAVGIETGTVVFLVGHGAVTALGNPGVGALVDRSHIGHGRQLP